MMSVQSFPGFIREKLIKKLENQRQDLLPIIAVLKEEPLAERYWTSLVQYTQEMEAKYNVTQGFQFLLKKYLEGY